MPSIRHPSQTIVAVGLADSSSVRILRPASPRPMRLDSSIAVAQRTKSRTTSCFRCTNKPISFANSTCPAQQQDPCRSIAVAATQPRHTGGQTPPVHRHSAAKRQPSPEGPRLTALAVFRPAETGRGRSSLPRRRTDTSANMGNARRPFRRRYMPGTTRNTRTASRLPCRFASTLPRAPTEAPLPDSGVSSTRSICGHRASPRLPESFPG